MIYLACGAISFVIGLLWKIYPSPRPNVVYGYYSVLAKMHRDGYRYSQKIAANYFMLAGLVQMALGAIIHLMHWDKFFLIWILTFWIFWIAAMIQVEKKLTDFLIQKGELPKDYHRPEVKKQTVKGFRDL
ncbi:MAG: hypothetical protein Q3960_00905 [Lactobacillus sp.]|nr:hypothetical protein [Lactobacillus sp.]